MSQRASSGIAPTPTRSLLATLLDRVWWFFTSVRVALWLIGTTIGWVLVATLAQSTFPLFVARHIPPLRGLMQRWATRPCWRLSTIVYRMRP